MDQESFIELAAVIATLALTVLFVVAALWASLALLIERTTLSSVAVSLRCSASRTLLTLAVIFFSKWRQRTSFSGVGTRTRFKSVRSSGDLIPQVFLRDHNFRCYLRGL